MLHSQRHHPTPWKKSFLQLLTVATWTLLSCSNPYFIFFHGAIPSHIRSCLGQSTERLQQSRNAVQKMLNNSADKPEAVLEIWLQHCLGLVAHYSWINVAHAQLIHGWLKIMIGVVPPFSSFFLQVQSLLYENTFKGPKYCHPLFLWTVHRPSRGVSSCCFGSGWGATEKGQAKTFGFQVAESAVGALLQPPR